MNNIKFRKNYLLKILILWNFVGIVSMILLIKNEITYFIIFILFAVLTSYFFLERKIEIFNPFTLFILYSYTVVFAALYLYSSNFEHNVFVNNQTFNTNIFELFNITLVYIIVCYIFGYLGYKTVKQNFQPNICIQNYKISIKIVNLVIIIFALFALVNFSFNIFKFADGNPFRYMENVSNRELEFQNSGGTTLFYLFGYIAGYLWLFKLLKKNKNISTSLFFLIYILITIFMKATTGRIFGTLSYVLSYFAIYYYANYYIESNNNKKYLVMLIFLMIFGCFFYFFRIASNLAYINQTTSGFIGTTSDLINLDNLMYFAIDKGNIPNISVLMKIIDGWGNEIPFLYGESLITWVYGILPTSLRPEGYQPSVIIKHVWYLHIQGGNLPPMGMGEMFANFWYFGGVIGMYFFGVLVGFLYNLLKKFNNYWYLVIFSNISVNFILIYSKGEFDNLSLWDIFPIGLTYLLLIVLTKLFIKKDIK